LRYLITSVSKIAFWHWVRKVVKAFWWSAVIQKVLISFSIFVTNVISYIDDVDDDYDDIMVAIMTMFMTI